MLFSFYIFFNKIIAFYIYISKLFFAKPFIIVYLFIYFLIKRLISHVSCFFISFHGPRFMITSAIDD
jgi:hypothetical protein